MANVADTFSTFGPIVSDAFGNTAAIFAGGRMIGGIMADVTIEELHRDTLTITQHPVEQSAPITDHAYMECYTIQIRGGFSNSSARSEGWVQAAYQQMLTLQNARKLFDVSTGKRYYKNMLMGELAVTTNAEFEYALNFTATCKQVILTTVASTGGSSSSSANTNGTDPNALSSNNASAAGLASDGSGNVSFPNEQATVGNSSAPTTISGADAPSSASFVSNPSFATGANGSGNVNLGPAQQGGVSAYGYGIN